MAANWYEQQIRNNNYLSPIGFKFTIEKAPKASYLCQSAAIPDISVGSIDVPTPLTRYPIEGNFTYGDFSIEFLVDENLENYLELHNWLRPLGVPYGYGERDAFSKRVSQGKQVLKFSDATLEVLTNSMTSNFKVVFFDLFPVSLSTLEFDATTTNTEFFRARATFRYSLYELRNNNNELMTLSDWYPEGKTV